jgi:hypothetical protein
MSIDATRWAWMQALKPTVKLVLLALADRAGENHECWPSIERLVKDTCLHRETVFAAIKELESQGLLKVTRVQGLGNKYQLTGVVDRYQYEKPDPSEKADRSEKPDHPVGKTGLPQSGKPDYHQSGFSYPEPINRTIKEPIKEPKRERTKKSAKTSLPKNFAISDSVTAWYAKQGYLEPIASHFEAFVDKCQAKGYTYVNWDAAFQNAIRDDWAGLRKNKTGRSTGRSADQTQSAPRYIPPEQRGYDAGSVIDSTAERL